MVSRRFFLGSAGLGAFAVSTGCLPPALSSVVRAAEIPPDRLKKVASLEGTKDRLLGYPINMNMPSDEFFAWRAELAKAGIDQFAFNNVGNPFRPGPIPFNTHDFEREVIRRFGKLFGFPVSDTWGFLSHSGTDSNMHGMYMGRTLLRGRTGISPKAYFTREAHYSVQILRDLLGLEAVMVNTLADGSMDPDDLASKLAENSGSPALVVATIGTTFKGAVDNIDFIQDKLSGVPSYLHLDAALFGGYLPFTPHASEILYQSKQANNSGRYDSIAVSCHKFFGFASPAGLFVTKQSLYSEFNELFSRIHNPEYIHHVPGTITCSRDAVKPAEFYFYTTPSAIARQTEDARLMLENTAWFLDQMHRHFPQYRATRANDLSNTVYFRNPGDAIVQKYSLATMHAEIDGQRESMAHVIIMPHVSQHILAGFLGDLEKTPVR